MVQAVVWMAALSVLLLFLAVPVTVRLLRTALEVEESVEPERIPEQRTRESPRQGGSGT